MAEATMTRYVLECTCGHDVKVNAKDRDDAVRQMKAMMDKKGMEEHFRKYHRGETMPSMSDVHARIESDIHQE